MKSRQQISKPTLEAGLKNNEGSNCLYVKHVCKQLLLNCVSFAKIVLSQNRSSTGILANGDKWSTNPLSFFIYWINKRTNNFISTEISTCSFLNLSQVFVYLIADLNNLHSNKRWKGNVRTILKLLFFLELFCHCRLHMVPISLAEGNAETV